MANCDWYEHNILKCICISNNTLMIQKQGEKLIDFYIEIDGVMAARMPASTFYSFWEDERYEHKIQHEYKYLNENFRTYTVIEEDNMGV